MTKAMTIDPTRLTSQTWADINDYLEAAKAAGEVVELSSRLETITPAQAAKRLSMSRSTILRRIRDGEISAVKIGTHHRIPLPEFERFRDTLMATMIAATADDINADLDG